jgi:hypothetical protein
MTRVDHVRLPLLLALALLSWQPGASAQSVCQPGDTIVVCVARLSPEKSKEAVQADQASIKNDQASVKKKTETGLEAIAGLSSSVKDFLPLLQFTGVLGPMQKNDETGAVSIALNTPALVGMAKGDGRKELQLKVVIETQPKLYDGIRKQLPIKEADTIEKGLLKGAEKKDNFALHGSYTIAARGLGRDFRQYQALYDMLFEEVRKSFGATTIEIVQAQMALSNAAPDLDKTVWSAMSATQQNTLDPLIRRRVAAGLAFEAAKVEAVKQSGIGYFGQLVNNQPQIFVTGSHARRDNLFGPSLTTASFNLEWGFGNALNDALDLDERICAGPTCTYDAYRKFVAAKQNAIKNGDRLSIHFDIVHNPRWEYTPPDPSVAFAVPVIEPGNTISFRLDYGRLIGVEDTGVASGRLDLAVQYERPKDLTLERWVTSFTVTKKIGELSIPFGLVYASNPKFLTGVDHGLTANVGLKFNLFPQTK